MKYIILIFLGALFLVGCGKEKAPPIQVEVIAPAVSQQLTQRFGDRFLKVGKVDYDAEKNCYHVEVHYSQNDQEKRYVMSMLRAYDTERQLLTYKGRFPLELIGEGNPQGPTFFPVDVDELMNK